MQFAYTIPKSRVVLRWGCKLPAGFRDSGFGRRCLLDLGLWKLGGLECAGVAGSEV